MRYLALATDYDGTLAKDGVVDEPSLAALERFRDSGRRLILVTGRELDELLGVFPRIDLFERVVAENGALLYRPTGREEKVLGEPPPPALVEAIRKRGVSPLSVGRGIIASVEPHQVAILDAIREMGLEWQVIFNKGSVMVLPSGVNKATGLSAALDELNLSPHNVVGVGDAENDHAFLSLCEFSVAVANALPMLKERADFVTQHSHGRGVVELIDQILADDLASLSRCLSRHRVLLGHRDDGAEQSIECYGVNVLVAGTSGSGKSTITTGILERLAEQGYQFVVVDPEGDYSTLEGAVVLGDPTQAPTVDGALDLLASPRQEAVINLVGIPIEHRPAFSDSLLPRLQELRARTGRPHWIVVDETHHLMPTTWHPTALTLPQRLEGMILITVHPDSVAKALLNAVDLVLAVGESPERTIGDYCQAVGEPAPNMEPTTLEPLEVLSWWRRTRRSFAGPGPLHAPAVGATPPLAEVRRGQPRPPQLLLPRPRGEAQPPRPELEPVPPDWRRRRRRDLDVPPPSGRLLGMVPLQDQGRRPGRRCGAGRETSGCDTPGFPRRHPRGRRTPVHPAQRAGGVRQVR